MRLRRTLVGALVTLMATVAVTNVAEPAFAKPSECTPFGGGRTFSLYNDNNGGGAYVKGVMCWSSQGDGYYHAWVNFFVYDTDENGAGATIRFEWLGPDGKTHYDVPPASDRAWTDGDRANASWTREDVRLLYVRACLTNTNSEAHHCGPKG
jgi:hypothetical protein